MDITLSIFLATLLLFIPLAGALLYVWWKFGKGNKTVSLMRTLFLLGATAILIYMITI